MNNYRANQHRLGRNDRGRVAITRESLLAKRVADNESGNTICPKIGAHQWTCTREECTCHRKEYAHTYACAVAINYPCFCGAKT